jgi:hypothetical protein
MYGILESSTNTGLDSELQCVFSTPLTIISNQPSFVQDMMSLKRRASSQNVQRWEIEAKLAPTNNSAKALVHGLISGNDSIIYARMPQVYGIETTEASITVNGNVAAGQDTFAFSGTPLKLKYGEFIQFSGQSKVYIVRDPGNGKEGVRIFPPLLSAITNGQALIFGDKVTLHARYDTDVQFGIKYTDGILSDPGVVRLIEDI